MIWALFLSKESNIQIQNLSKVSCQDERRRHEILTTMISYTIKTTARRRKFTPSFSFAQNLHRSFSQTNPSVSLYSNLITHCLSLKSLTFAESIHARLVKIGFHRNTFLGNRLVDLYSRFGDMGSSSQAFHDIPNKNSFTWNLLVMGYFKIGCLESASQLFDEMPERDIVSWNSMISGYALNGLMEYALLVFLEMQEAGLRPNGFTFSIVVSCVNSSRHGKEIHGSIIRSGLNSTNVVLGNSLIDMYGNLGLVDYAVCAFLLMEELDVISWNSMISACKKSGYWEWALDHFGLMRVTGFLPDQFTVSTMVTVCANLRDLENGKKVFAQCIRMGFLSNSIVSSAVIDMFSKCDRLEDSVRLFEEMHRWDSALCNSMISGYSRHGFAGDALWLFLLTLRENLRPTEFTFVSILSSASCLVPAEQGTQIHSLVIKSGSDSDVIVGSSLVDMYSKSGLVDAAMKIFSKMVIRDLVSWNTMIMGFARNGRGVEALQIFGELCKWGPPPDRITLAGVLLACSYGGLVDEGLSIFSLMQEKYGVMHGVEHYTCMVDMLGRAGKLMEAMETIETMPHVPTASIWGVLLGACMIHGDVELAERVAERVMELEPHTSLPYLVLGRMHASRGRWESMARVTKAMKERGVKKATGCSWIGIKNNIFVFRANEILHCGGEAMYSMLRLLAWEMLDEGYKSQQYALVGDGGEE
ncbi:pentatricopeptide repeat-containing protein At1g43980, mitochondrial [Magnolia sinica]|uniref:pentatricopeptide repeat-containing protein At1g43980, mitochondrial n=1 Tax=Magnolia sinica TaxID=86752 RepID=UPI002659ED80|nr:pentatricopeptide repeat-containing protein At1g43980, mitochondrial [Magnolia sinica]